MQFDISPYVNSEPPEVRPFQMPADRLLVEDFVDGARKIKFIECESPQIAEFVTVDYDLVAFRDLLSETAEEVVLLTLVIITPTERVNVTTKQIIGVSNANELWFKAHGGYLTANAELELNKKVREHIDSLAGGDMGKMIMDQIRKRREEQQGKKDEADPSDWWKSKE